MKLICDAEGGRSTFRLGDKSAGDPNRWLFAIGFSREDYGRNSRMWAPKTPNPVPFPAARTRGSMMVDLIVAERGMPCPPPLLGRPFLFPGPFRPMSARIRLELLGRSY
jgi:hypothetical protein